MERRKFLGIASLVALNGCEGLFKNSDIPPSIPAILALIKEGFQLSRENNIISVSMNVENIGEEIALNCYCKFTPVYSKVFGDPKIFYADPKNINPGETGSIQAEINHSLDRKNLTELYMALNPNPSSEELVYNLEKEKFI